MNVFFKRLGEISFLPSKASQHDAGYDLFSVETHTLAPMERKLFKTGIALEIPSGFYGRIAPRSGMAFKNGIDVLAGVIDSSYRGEIGVILINLGEQPKIVSLGDRIAQLIIEKYHEVKFIEVSELNESIRGAKGIGSSGS